MTTTVFTLVVLGPTAVVAAALFAVMWRERRSARDARIALLSGGVLSLWAMVASVLASRGFFRPQDTESVPPVAINLLGVLTVLFVSLATSTSLRRLLTRQANLIRLHLWRFEGIVFLVLMARGEMPALWALPAGIGDILVGATAPWVARHADAPQGRRRAIIWNLLGIADLIVAVGLGIMTNPGPTQVFDTVPTSELVTHFPMALVPTFLVPLAFVLHVISSWQLLGGRWVPHLAARGTEPMMQPQGIFGRSRLLGVIPWMVGCQRNRCQWKDGP